MYVADGYQIYFYRNAEEKPIVRTIFLRKKQFDGLLIGNKKLIGKELSDLVSNINNNQRNNFERASEVEGCCGQSSETDYDFLSGLMKTHILKFEIDMNEPYELSLTKPDDHLKDEFISWEGISESLSALYSGKERTYEQKMMLKPRIHITKRDQRYFDEQKLESDRVYNNIFQIYNMYIR